MPQDWDPFRDAGAIPLDDAPASEWDPFRDAGAIALDDAPTAPSPAPQQAIPTGLGLEGVDLKFGRAPIRVGESGAWTPTPDSNVIRREPDPNELGFVQGAARGLGRGVEQVSQMGAGLVRGPVRNWWDRNMTERFQVMQGYTGATPEERQQFTDAAKASAIASLEIYEKPAAGFVERSQRRAEQLAPSRSVAEGSAFEPSNPRWWVERGTELIPMLAAQVGAGLALRSPIAFATPGGAMVAGATYNEAYEDLRQDGQSDDEARKGASKEALVVGLTTGVLESVVGGEFFGRNPALRGLFQKVFRNKYAAAGAAGFTAEGVTEVLQEIGQDAAAIGFRDDWERMKDAWDRYRAMFFLAGALGAGTNVILETGRRTTPQQIDQALDNVVEPLLQRYEGPSRFAPETPAVAPEIGTAPEVAAAVQAGDQGAAQGTDAQVDAGAQQVAADAVAPDAQVTTPSTVPLGLNRPSLPDPSLKVLSDAEFSNLHRNATRTLDRLEALLEQRELTPAEVQQLAQAQDQWSATKLEQVRRNYQDTHPGDVLRLLMDRVDSIQGPLDAESGSMPYQEAKILAQILMDQGALESGIQDFSSFQRELTPSSDQTESLRGRAEKLKEFLAHAFSPAEPGLTQEATPPGDASAGAPSRRLADFTIKPSPDSPSQVASSNDLTVSRELARVPIAEVSGGVDVSQPSERKRVDKLKEQILSEDGYVARLIIDGQGNVVEGQHRLQALQELGFDEVPVVRLRGVDDFIPNREAVEDVMKSNGVSKRDARTNLIENIGELISDEKGNVAALRDYDPPKGYEAAWNAAIEEVIRQNTTATAAQADTPATVQPAPEASATTDTQTDSSQQDAQVAAQTQANEQNTPQAAQVPGQEQTPQGVQNVPADQGVQGQAPDAAPARVTQDQAARILEPHYKDAVAAARTAGAIDAEMAASDAWTQLSEQAAAGKVNLADNPGALFANAAKQRAIDQTRRETAGKRDARQTVSADAPLSAEGDATIADTIAAPESLPAGTQMDVDAVLKRAGLTDAEARLMAMAKTGEFDGIASIAKALGISRQAANKTFNAALAKISGVATADKFGMSSSYELGVVPDSWFRTQKTIQWIKEWATVWGNKPPEFRPVIERANAAERSYYTRGQMIIRELQREARKAYGRKNQAQAEQEIRAVLDGTIAPSMLPPKVAEHTGRLRNLIDELSIRAINESVVNPDMANTFMDNLGSWMRRSYRVHSDPDWHRKVDPDVLRDAKQWIKTNWGKTDAETAVIVADMLNPLKAGNFMLGKGKIGSKDVTSLIKRKNIAPEIRALWGEIINPYESAAESVARLANMIEKHHAQVAMRDIGLATGIFSTTKSPEHIQPMTGDTTPGPFDVLSGIYTTPEVFAAMQDGFAGSKLSLGQILLEAVRSFAGTAKAMKTVMSPQTWGVNYIGAIMTNVAQGLINPAAYARGVNAVLEGSGVFTKVGNKFTVNRQALQDKVELLTKYDLLNQNITAQDMVQAIERSLLGRIPGVNRVFQTAAGIFQAGDNIAKFHAWEGEMARYKKAFPAMPQAELDSRVAEVVAMTRQMYDRTPRWMKEASQVLPVQSFLNFMYDMTRVSVNTVRLGKAEIQEGIQTGNRELVKIGSVRMASFSAVMAASSSLGIAAVSRFMFGIEDEEEQAVREFLPPWFKHETLLWASSMKDGKATYANVGYLLPHANVMLPFEAAMRQDDLGVGLSTFFEVLKDQYIQEPVHLNPVFDAIRNVDQRGREIVNREDPNKARKLFSYVVDRTMKPGLADNIERISKALSEETGPFGRKYSVKDEMLRMMAVRAQTIDVRQNLPFRARELNQRWNNATNIYRLSKNRNLPEQELEQRYEDAEQARQAIFAEFQKVRTAAFTLGVSGAEFRRSMKSIQGMPNALIDDVMRDRYRPLPR